MAQYEFTRDPLINQSLLCKNPRILQEDFQLYKYNIDVMEKLALSVKCSFRFTIITNCIIIKGIHATLHEVKKTDVL
jgi:hypothetical protein